ncbi:MAG: hypothetical protein AAFR71_05640 [Pseudomonadota bacterium]
MARPSHSRRRAFGSVFCGRQQVLVGPYATLLGVDPGSTEWPDLSGLADNGLALLVPIGQMLAAMPKARLDMPPYDHPPLVGRVSHLFGHKLGLELPDVLTIALDAVACLCVPLWAIPVADRQAVADLCKHP